MKRRPRKTSTIYLRTGLVLLVLCVVFAYLIPMVSGALFMFSLVLLLVGAILAIRENNRALRK